MNALRCLWFRNDDVRGRLDESLRRITDLFLERRVPLVMAVEPANVTQEVVAWLREQMALNPDLVEVMQHGFDHKIKNRYRKGEFGGQRSYEEQRRDIAAGQRLMNEYFSNLWFPAFNFPYGPYNPAAMQALNDLGYRVVNSHFNPAMSRRWFYWVGHRLGRGYLFGRHVSWHLQRYPGTQLLEVDMGVSFIRRYVNEDTCAEFLTLKELIADTLRFQKLPVIGVLLHHRYHTDPSRIRLVADYLDWARQTGLKFVGLREIYREWAPRAGLRTAQRE